LKASVFGACEDGTRDVPVAETPEERLARLKSALVPLAKIHCNTPLLDMPGEVLAILADIAVEHGGDVKPALAAWCDAIAAARRG